MLLFSLLILLGATAYAESPDPSIFPEVTTLTTGFHRHVDSHYSDEASYQRACDQEAQETIARVKHARVLNATCKQSGASIWFYGGYELYGIVSLKVWLEGPLVENKTFFYPQTDKIREAYRVNYRSAIEEKRQEGERDEKYVLFTWDRDGEGGSVGKGEHGTLWTLKR